MLNKLKLSLGFDSALIEEGHRLLKINENLSALECFEKAITANAKDISAWRGKGEALFFLERYDEALTIYNKIQDEFAITGRKYIEVSQRWSDKGDVLIKLKRFEEAMLAYQNALHNFKHDPLVNYSLSSSNGLLHLKRSVASLSFITGKIACVCQDYQLAKKMFDESLKFEDDRHLSEIVFYFRRVMLLNLGHYEDIVKFKKDIWTLHLLGCYQQALEIYPVSNNNNNNNDNIPISSLINKATVLFSLGCFENSLNNYNTAIHKDRVNIQALTYKGLLFCCWGSDKFEEAKHCFEEALNTCQVNAGKALIKVCWGFLSFVKKEFSLASQLFESAEQHFTNSLKLLFDDTDTLLYVLGEFYLLTKSLIELGKGFLALQQNNKEHANLLFLQSVERVGKIAFYHHLKGICFITLGDEVEARGCFQKILELVPDHQYAKEEINNSYINNNQDKATLQQENNVLKENLQALNVGIELLTEEKIRLSKENQELREMLEKTKIRISELERDNEQKTEVIKTLMKHKEDNNGQRLDHNKNRFSFLSKSTDINRSYQTESGEGLTNLSK